MSKKQGGKQKKGQASQGLEAVIEEQKRQILQQSFTIKQLQDRLSRMTEQNNQIVVGRDDTQKKYEQKIDNQRIFIENHKNTIDKLEHKVNNLQIMKVQLESIIKTQEKQIQFLQQVRTRQMEEYKKLVASEMALLENQLKQYNNYMKERDDLFEQRNKLKNDLQNEKQDKIRQLADKQRQKVQQTDTLKDQMLMKIRDMRTNLLSLKKQQLSTTTRLAVLQNHQLTSQLQFQSKQTQKLLFQNEGLQKKLVNMQKDVQIHKQVQQQLAKRSHISKGIIKKLTNKIAQLQDQLKNYKESEKNNSDNKLKKQNNLDKQIQKQAQMIQVLDKTIQQKDKKYLKIQADYQLLQNENKNIKSRLKQIQRKSYELSNLLLKYYEQAITGKTDIKVNQNQQTEYILDIRGLKKKNVKQWQPNQCKIIVTLILNQLKNHINKHNLGIPTMNKSQILLVNDDEISQSKLLPNIGIGIHEHSLIRKDSKKLRQIPTSLVPKLVGSNLRQWGRTVHSNSVSNLAKKYK